MIKRTIFQEEEAAGELDDNAAHKKAMKKALRNLLTNKQNIYLKENLASLKNRKILEGFTEETPGQIQQCFFFFAQALANARNLRVLDLNGMDLHPLLAIEIGQGIQNNNSLRELNLSACKLNSFCLQYIFSSISNHKTLQSINLYNNQGFSIELMNDFNQFVLKGKNHIKRIKLTHCNISSTALSFLLRNLKYSQSITAIDISMMPLDDEVLTSVGIALQHYKGKKQLDYLNLSDTSIKNTGLNTLAQRVSWNLRKINLKELILKGNKIDTKDGVPHLEAFLRKVNNIQKLDLTDNKIDEFTCSELLTRKIYEVNLTKNHFKIFPSQFFMNTLILNLSDNSISSQGAFQLSSILRQKPMWLELNLSNNQLQSEGFNSLIFGLRDNRMLKKLIVANNKLDGEALICYMINHEQVYFEHLDISVNYIRQQMIFVLLNYIKSGVLRCLRCSYLLKDDETKRSESNPVLPRSDEQQKSNTQFQLTSFNLRELDFHGNKEIFTPVMTSLAKYYNKIEILDLSACAPITDQDINDLYQFLKRSTTIHDLNLRDLNLGKLSKDSIKKLSEACFNSSLKYLNLSKNRLYKQFKHLFNFGNQSQGWNYKLEILDLSLNQIESRHASHLMKMLMQFRNLQELNIQRNCVNFHILHAINKVIQTNRSIKRLNLSHTRLSADDLLILSQIVANENIQELNLANNPYTSKLKSFFYQCTTSKLDTLKLNQLYLDGSNYLALQTILKAQKRHLRGVSFDSVIFQSGDYVKIIEMVQRIKNLEYFGLIYNPIIDRELVGKQIMNFKTLKVMKLNSVSLTWTYVQELAEWMASPEHCNLIQLDLSRNRLNENIFGSLCTGIAKNKTLLILSLNECELGNHNLREFGQAVSVNSTIQTLEIKKNNIVDNFIDFVRGYSSNLQQGPKQGSQSSLQEIHLNQNRLNKDNLIELFVPQNNQMFQKNLFLKYLYLEGCLLKRDIFSAILDGQRQFKNTFGFQSILSLSLNSNNLTDDVAALIQEILENNHKIQELNLSDNQFTSTGMLSIFIGMLKNQTIRILNIAKNQLNDVLIEELPLLECQLASLEFLIVRNNSFSAMGSRRLAEIIQYQTRLFVDNNWSQLNDTEALIIIQQYTRIGQKYRINQSVIPQFLKEIQIQKSNLTDYFCEELARYYPFLSFIELIDISDNPCITMYGKVYLFIHLFDLSYEKHALKGLYISDSYETIKLFDDGLFRYILLKLKNFLNPNNMAVEDHQSGSQIDQKKVQKMIGGMCGTWLMHKIDKVQAYLEIIDPPQFIVSTLFIGKFRRNDINIKLLMVFFWMCSLLMYQLAFLKQMYNHGTMNVDAMHLISQCPIVDKLPDCYDLAFTNFIDDIYFFVIVMVIGILVEIVQLTIAVTLRRKIQPVSQIVHPKLLKYLHQKWPHKEELFAMFQSFLSKVSNVPEKLAFFYMCSIYASPAGQQFKTMFYCFAIHIFIRYAEVLLLWGYNNVQFLRQDPKNDQAKYLSLLQRLIHHQGYYVMNDILYSLCPSSGIYIMKGVKINYICIVELYRVFFFDSTLIVILALFFEQYNQWEIDNFRGEDRLGFVKLWIVLAIIKCAISIFQSFFIVLTIQPPVVKQHAFNQALAIKKFWDNRKQFVQPTHFKIEYNFEKVIDKKIMDKKKVEVKKENIQINKHKMDDIPEAAPNEVGDPESELDERDPILTDDMIQDEDVQAAGVNMERQLKFMQI